MQGFATKSALHTPTGLWGYGSRESISESVLHTLVGAVGRTGAKQGSGTSLASGINSRSGESELSEAIGLAVTIKGLGNEILLGGVGMSKIVDGARTKVRGVLIGVLDRLKELRSSAGVVVMSQATKRAAPIRWTLLLGIIFWTCLAIACCAPLCFFKN